MIDNSLLVKIFDEDSNYVGKGKLDRIAGTKIIVKGSRLPVLKSKSKVYIHIFDPLRGISVYECIVNIGADMQLTATIIRKTQSLERRKSLKIRTEYETILKLVIRDKKVFKTEQPIRIKMLNLSIGGMLFTSNIDFFVDDIITFEFNYYEDNPIELDAKIIRIDPATEDNPFNNYGCMFIGITPADENIICKYLYERQLQIYKKK